MARVELQHVNKSFGSTEVVHDVSLSIEAGEFCVFVGPSGCGKSTLLRMIAGLEETSSGEIMIGERNVTDEEPADRGVAMVFQSYALYPHMTVADNMSFGLRMTHRPKAEIAEKVARAAKYPAPRGIPPAQAGPAFGRAAPACRHRTGHRPKSRRSFFSTSRSATSMRSSGCRCGSRSPSCTRCSATRRST